MVVTNLNLPDIDGLDLLVALDEERLAGRTLVVTNRRDEHSREIMHKMRLDGFFDVTTEGASGLADAVRLVAVGEGYFSASFDEACVPDGKEALHKVLSPRLREVFAVRASSSDDESAGYMLGVKPFTVRNAASEIRRQLGLRDSREMTFEAIARGVVRVEGARLLRCGFERILAENRGARDGRGECQKVGDCS